MFIDDGKIGNVAVALAKYSEYLNDHKPSEGDTIMLDLWKLTRREVWDLRTEIDAYWHSLLSRSEAGRP